MIVECTDCGTKYRHGQADDEKLTCPRCNGRHYRAEGAKTEQKQALNESRQPRLLTEDR